MKTSQDDGKKKKGAPSSDRDETDEESEDKSDKSGRNSPIERNHRGRCRCNYLTIKDVEGSLTYFSGDNMLPIEKWIEEFEDTSMLLR